MNSWKDIGWSCHVLMVGALKIEIQSEDGGKFRCDFAGVRAKARWTDLASAKVGAVEFARAQIKNAQAALDS